MFEIDIICPYTGLRSFSEDEALYFKGRDEQIEKITRQLEQRKFLMVTGASGDGKSSLVYAGLIPQARAGFFKTTYTNWYVADFRPERSPLANLAKSLASQMNLENPLTIETELGHGFSSLVDLYKTSNLYTGKKQMGGPNETDPGDELNRKAGNLLILVDQFEEFFTNPENYHQGVPSQESRLVLNLLLETSRLALQEDLPIYVVCTMRSDYIGQCAAFRGLPEYIGFSQFFVPRLKRKELQQVIEEPAILSGNRISKRLVDRLIYDLEEGLDQLPILQHALKQIWSTSDEGKNEMDLIHYAMVGGMPESELPEENREEFREWREKLPDYQKELLKNPGLSSVLDIHANKLFQEAEAFYNQSHQNPITSKEAKLIIGMAFACLTRIDENRAVRNRMTLEEIAQIINVPNLDAEVVGGVLNLFREVENTLVRPFISEEPDTRNLKPDTVLDITHESLIRNWDRLKTWADQEFEYYTTYLDFKQQLDRWLLNDKSEGFLLPIGTLTYFENWYKDCRPNEYWIHRYNKNEEEGQLNLDESRTILKNTREFFRKSSLKLLVSKAFMKYGSKKIAAVIGILAVFVLSGFLIYESRIRQNEYVIQKTLHQGMTLLKDREADPGLKADFVINSERLDPGSFRTTLSHIPDKATQAEISIKIFDRLYGRNKESNPGLKTASLHYADSLIQSADLLNQADPDVVGTGLINLIDLIRNQSYHLHFNQDQKVESDFQRSVTLLGDLVFQIYSSHPEPGQFDSKALNMGLETALNHRVYSSDQIRDLVNLISPFENDQGRQRFELIFPTNQTINVGFNQVISHSGGYQKLAYLYSSVGDVDKTMRCIDSLRKHNDDYDNFFNNAFNIAGYFVTYNNLVDLLGFTKAYSYLIGVNNHTFLHDLINRSGYFSMRQTIKFIQRGNLNDNLALMPIEDLNTLFGVYLESLENEILDPDELNFQRALAYKQQAVFQHKYFSDKGVNEGSEAELALFERSLALYQSLPGNFLDEEIEAYFLTAFFNLERRLVKRRHHYLFPDHFMTLEVSANTVPSRYFGDAFFKFLIQQGRIGSLYQTPDDFQLLVDWIDRYFESYDLVFPRGPMNRNHINYSNLPNSTFQVVDSIIVQSAANNALDQAWVKMKLIYDYYENGDTLKALEKFNQLEFKKFTRDENTNSFPFDNFKMEVCKMLALHKKRDEAIQIISQFQRPHNRVIAYSKMATVTMVNDLEAESSVYLDSAYSELNRLRGLDFAASFATGQDFRTNLVEVLSLKGNDSDDQAALQTIKNMPWGMSKPLALGTFIRAKAQTGNYFEAVGAIPELASASDKLNFYNSILYQEVLENSGDSDRVEWEKYDHSYGKFLDYCFFIFDLYQADI